MPGHPPSPPPKRLHTSTGWKAGREAAIDVAAPSTTLASLGGSTERAETAPSNKVAASKSGRRAGFDVASLRYRTWLDNCLLTDVERARALEIFGAFPRVWGVDCPFERFAAIPLLAQHPPAAPLSELRATASRDPWTAVVQQVLGPWPIPPFLLRSPPRPPADVHRTSWEWSWVVAVARTIARGASLASLFGTPSVPAPLTHRMIHRFIHSPSTLSPIEALREAQVVCMGGPEGLGARLATSTLGDLQGADPRLGEPWWSTVLHWFARHPEAADADLDDTFTALRSLRARSKGTFTLKGRTPASLAARVADELAWISATRHNAFPMSGFLSQRVRVEGEVWTITELTTPAALTEETQALKHCAERYIEMCATGVTSLWSVRRAGHRRATIEVVRAAARVAQVRGSCNRPPDAEEAEVVRRWAARNGLSWVG
jgi:hypothetical protein